MQQIFFNFEYNEFYPFIKHRVFGFSEFLASIGGLMGLIAGVSVISVIEFFYHFLSHLFPLGRNRKITPEATNKLRNRNRAVNENHVLYQFSKYVVEFVRASSIHGVPLTTGRNRSRLQKLFWSLIVLFSIGACSYLINDARNLAELNPIAFGIDENIWNVKDVIK